MTINTALLKTTNDLQQYFVDKETGLPLSAGVVTLYKDNSRTFLKNWYYQTGQAPNYTYAALPNPLTLSSVGTIVDVNGTDVLPFYYPVSESDGTSPETYYITVDSADGTRQFTRQNFPFDGTTENPSIEVSTLQNLIVNNNFWRNVGSQTLTNVTSTVSTGGLAPSAHDGFSMPDLQFFKNTTGAVETVSFLPFGSGVTPLLGKGDITPEFYLNHHCTVAGAETLKYYQMPIVLHVKNLEGEGAVFTIDAQSSGDPVNSVLQFGIYQFPGTTASSPPSPVITGTFQLTSVWNKYKWPFTFPLSDLITPSATGDDALYLVIFLPTTKTCNISFTNPSIYLGDTVPTNNYQTYDVSDSIINSPRTGDIRIALNSFFPFGWVPTNDGTIGSPDSNATTRANTDTWQLFNLIWNGISNNYAPVYDSSGVASTRGTTSYADFVANKRLALTKTLGRVIAGLNSYFPINSSGKSYTTAFATNNNLNFGTAFSQTPIVGTPVLLTGTTLSAPLQPNTIYYVTNGAGAGVGVAPTTTAFSLAATLDDANLGYTLGAITLTSNGSGDQVVTNALGAIEGSSGTTDVANHTHHLTNSPAGTWNSTSTNNTGIPSFTMSGTNDQLYLWTSPADTDDNTGGVASMSLMQPTTFMNFFIKL